MVNYPIGCPFPPSRLSSVMAIKSEVFGRCVEEIDVSVEIENRDAWLCCG
jgi:hypothetical protein